MTTDNGPTESDDTNRVRPGHECPRCGEDDADTLVWIDEHRVRCARCQHVYQPFPPAED